MAGRVSAVLFVRDLERMLAFYSALLAEPCVYQDTYHGVIRCGSFALDLQRLPAGSDDDAVPRGRDRAALKLVFPVDSIPRARRVAAEYGAELDPAPPRWVVDEQKICLGRDPEGNVFQLQEDD